MKTRAFFSTLLFATSVSVCLAGSLNKGVWSPSNCPPDPTAKAPKINSASAEGFNKSVKDFNDWQKQVSDYNTCIVNEANADNTAIANSVNGQQEKLKALAEKLHGEAEAAKTKLSDPAAPK